MRPRQPEVLISLRWVQYFPEQHSPAAEIIARQNHQVDDEEEEDNNNNSISFV